jgi:hypothetical protein
MRKKQMPETVKKVHEAMVRSAKAAGQSDEVVYTGHQPLNDPYEWAVGDNYERLEGCLVYNERTTKWCWRCKCCGEDTPLYFGEDEAIADAEIMYTG